MSAEVSVKTFDDILNAVLERAKIASSTSTAETTTLNTLKRIVNDRYHSVSYSKHWPWREMTRIMPIYGSTKASDFGVLITLTKNARAITSNLPFFIDVSIRSRVYSPSNNIIYEIVGVDSPTEASISMVYAGETETSGDITFIIDSYGLYPDYSEIVEIVPLGLNSSTIVNPILKPINSEEMLRLQASDPVLRGTPRFYTISGKKNYEGPYMGDFVMGYDFMGSPQTPSMVLYPTVTGFYSSPHLQITYGLQIIPLVESTDEPIMPLERRRILVNGALADWFALQNKTDLSKFYEDKFNLMLSNMKADFDKSEIMANFQPNNPGRRRGLTYTRLFPSVD